MADALVDEVLVAWKEGEQLLPSLSPLSADHEIVRLAIADLRSTYVTLVGRGYRAADHVEKSAAAIENAMRSIREISDRTPRRA